MFGQERGRPVVVDAELLGDLPLRGLPSRLPLVGDEGAGLGLVGRVAFLRRGLEARGEVTKAGASLVFVRGLVTAEAERRPVLSFSGVIKKIRPRPPAA